MQDDVNLSAAPDRDFDVMGVVNVTPDSFSDAGRYFDPAAAVEHGLDARSRGCVDPRRRR